MKDLLRYTTRWGYTAYLGSAVIVLALAAAGGAVTGLFAHTPDLRIPLPDMPSVMTPMPQDTLADVPAIARYIEVIESCGPEYEDVCVNVRSGPGLSYPAVAQLRHGVVLRVSDVTKADDHTWYRIIFDEWVRYPDRIAKDWYVAGEYVRPFEDSSAGELQPGERRETSKRIVIDRSAQRLFAYDGDELFMNEQISTGLDLTPTPRGTFRVYRKTPSRYMQGPLPGVSDQYYDLPGVPWNLYFTTEGGAIHGAFWHANFGKQWSHGCINMRPEAARTLYYWADLGTPVIVRD